MPATRRLPLAAMVLLEPVDHGHHRRDGPRLAHGARDGRGGGGGVLVGDEAQIVWVVPGEADGLGRGADGLHTAAQALEEPRGDQP